MPWSGIAPNKSFTRDNGTHSGSDVWQQDEAALTGIEADRHDTHDEDIADSLNLALLKDGGNKPTANINAGGFGFTNLSLLGSEAETTVASAATTDVLGSAALFVAVSGTTTITSLGTGTNRFKIVRFTGALTLTHNATTLIIPGGANITTVAGDTMLIVSDGSSNVRVISYQRAATAAQRGEVELATAAEFRTGTDAARVPAIDQIWAAAAEVTLTDAATIAVDFATFINAVVTLGGNRAMGNPTNEKVGQTGYIRIVQDGTGTRTLSYGTDWEFAGGAAPVLSTTAADQDMLFYTIIATNRIFASLIKDIS